MPATASNESDSAPDSHSLGRRIVVWGATGSGKSIFARRIGQELGLEVVELDSIRHAHGWDSTDWDDFRQQLTSRLGSAKNGWVTDGSYSPISDVYLARADTIVWLHLPWRVSFWRLLQRTISRARNQEPLYGGEGGPHESWRISFASKHSILWWSVAHHRAGVASIRRRLAGLAPSVRIHELRSAHEVDEFLARVATAAST